MTKALMGTGRGPARGERFLVTGATGAVGPAIVDEIVASGARVRVLTREAVAHDAPRAWLSDPSDVEVVVGDVGDHDALRTAMQGVDVVVHAAGVAHRRPGSEAAVHQLFDANVGGARAVAEVARAAAVRRVVFISSAAVYGPGDGRSRDESAPMRPTTAYGRAKLESEQIMGEILGDRLVALRVCAVYGRRLRGQYAVLAAAVRSTWPIAIPDGHGHCLITEHDLAHVVRHVAQDPGSGVTVLNVSDGNSYAVKEIVTAMGAAIGVPRWRTPVVPGFVGAAVSTVLARAGGASEWSRRQRLLHGIGSLTHGPQLDASALRRVMPDRRTDSLVEGWRRALAEM